MPIPDAYTIEEMRRYGVKDVFGLMVARANERQSKADLAEREWLDRIEHGEVEDEHERKD